MATTTFRIGGMTCGACTSAVESGLVNLDGISDVSVSLVMERAVVSHDPEKISAENLKDIIEDRGFEAEILATDFTPAKTDNNRIASTFRSMAVVTKSVFAVEGMTCGACTSAIENGFLEVSGIISLNISLLSERLVIEHDASLISAREILEVVEERGFGATLLNTTSSEISDTLNDFNTSENGNLVTTVSIEGMTCGACTSAVESGFQDLDGKISFNISLLAERAVIVHNPTKLTSEQIVTIIEDRGFDAKIISTNSALNNHSLTSYTTQLKVFGVKDGNAANNFESKLRSITGINSAKMSMATLRLIVSYNAEVIGLRAIVEAIEMQGYNAIVAHNDDNSAQLESLAKTKEIAEWRRAFKASLSYAIPVFLISMIIPMFLPALDFGSYLLVPGIYLGDVICLVLTIPVQFGIGKRFYKSAYKSMIHFSPTMDVLVVLGTSAAFFFSVIAMVVSFLAPPHTRPNTTFDTSSMLITFISLGRFLENRAKGQTSKALSRLMSLAPSMATIYIDPIAAEKMAEDGAVFNASRHPNPEITSSSTLDLEKLIPTELVQVGDIVILRPGDKIPADGIVIHGETYVDESMITGEAMPVLKRKNSLLIGGTVNGTGRVDFRVTRTGTDTQLSQIVKLVQDAQTTRAPIQRLADTIAGYFVPAILFLGLTTFITWMILSHALSNPPTIFVEERSGGKFMVCVNLCISVIVFACPCALGLATPTAVMVGTGVGAENGILVKGGAALETTTKITKVVLDKTGTLTLGKMTVCSTKLMPKWQVTEERRDLWWKILGLAEMGSEHPIGKAVLAAAKEKICRNNDDTIDGSVNEFEAVVGQGVSALVEPAKAIDVNQHRILIGNVSFLRANNVIVPGDAINLSEESNVKASKSIKATSAGTTNIYTAIDGEYSGHLCLADTVKQSAAACITALHLMGIKTAIVTGDQKSTALAVARIVGIPPHHVHAGMTPGQKQEIIQRFQREGECIAMVGDGINDSPALATADVGIAMSSGTDVAMEAADIVLMRSDDLMSIPTSIQLARSIFSRIKLNLSWACGYNLIGLPFAMGIFLPFGLHLHPMAAGAAMATSSVSVVVSSLLLKFWKRPRWMDNLVLEERQSETKKGGWHVTTIWGRMQNLTRPLIRRQKDEIDGYLPLRTFEPV
ncbi:unnamed protein product [Blumeria hordei]|uniref:P-type Cu(+) transporter n=1 Tax=Blumeria hordei TaxID=2867405 RepID=A0A383UR46_BLUHO|nr:unnamed protein product [Blumeria hordei]